MRTLACALFCSSLLAAGVADAAAPSSRARGEAVQQVRLQRGSTALEKLRNDARRRRMRDAWESIIRELDAAVRAAPDGKLAGEAQLAAAKARIGLFEASRSPVDAKAALAALRKVDEDHPGSIGREALVAAVQVALHTKDAGDRASAGRRLAERYPSSQEGKYWATRLGLKKPAAAAQSPSRPAAATIPPVQASDEDDDEDEGPVVTATREPEVDVGHETSKIVEQMIAEARGGGEAKGDTRADAPHADDEDAEPEEAEAPAPKTSTPIVRAVKDAVAALTEPQPDPTAASKAKELRSEALRAGSINAQLGLKVRRVVVDAGHGGKDTGAIGPHGLREKDAALAIAKKVAARLKSLGFEVVMTRKSDVFVPLEERTRIANESRADLFVSIHCNAARQRKLAGVETWTLNVASDRYAARLAAFENAEAERTVSELRMILADLATRANSDDARELAQSVQTSLVRTLRGRVGKVTDHGVKQALFFVLLGTHMPSILVETGFISNPAEEQRLRSARFQEGTADAISRGLKDFVDARRRLARAP